MAYYFKTQGREYSLSLESDGLLHANELGLSAETLPELQELVKARVKEEKSAPRIPVLIIDNRWSHVQEWTEGSASGKVANYHGYRWVSYKDREGKTKRQTFSKDRLFADTPENREKANKLLHLGRRIQELMKLSDELKDSMLTFEGQLELQREAETV